jgi:hypothetical protein
LARAQVKAFRLLVNRSATFFERPQAHSLCAWAGWDLELLVLELQELERAKYDLSLTGFDSAELDELLVSGPTVPDAAFHKLSAQRSPARRGVRDLCERSVPRRALCAEAAPPAPEAPIYQAGDLWRLGPHRVLCGDAANSQAVARLGGNSKPRLMVTDPPCSQAEARATDWSEAFALAPSLEVAYVWHASKFTREVLDGLLRIGFEDHQQIIWDKGRPVPAIGLDWSGAMVSCSQATSSTESRPELLVSFRQLRMRLKF